MPGEGCYWTDGTATAAPSAAAVHSAHLPLLPGEKGGRYPDVGVAQRAVPASANELRRGLPFDLFDPLSPLAPLLHFRCVACFEKYFASMSLIPDGMLFGFKKFQQKEKNISVLILLIVLKQFGNTVEPRLTGPPLTAVSVNFFF